MDPRTDAATLDLVAAAIHTQVDSLRARTSYAREHGGGLAHERALLRYAYERLQGSLHIYGLLAGAPADGDVSEAEAGADLLGVDLQALSAAIEAATR